ATSPVPPSALSCAPPAGVRIEVGHDETWRVEPSDDPPVPPVRRYAERGRLRTLALDSGVEDCEWHRVRVDADQPAGTGVTVRAATVTDPSAEVEEAAWRTLPAGPAGTDALLVGAPRGRYL